MSTLPEPKTGELMLFIAPQAGREEMMALTAVLALRGPVRVIDGGNRFDAYQIARLIRRQTTQLDAVLSRISVARAFTCYQMVGLLLETAVSPLPQLALDFLATFYDENISVSESHRLLGLVIKHIQRLRHHAPIVISVRPPPQNNRIGLVHSLMEIADHIHIRQPPTQTAPTQLL